MRNKDKEYGYWIPRTDTLYKREVVQCSACHQTQLDPAATCEHCGTSMMRCAENAQGTCKSYPHCDGCGAKVPAVAEPECWIIPVTWEMCGTIAIPKTKAPCLEDAIRLCNEDSDDLGLPSGEYVDGSFAATGMEPGYIRQFYNNGVHDAKSEGFYHVQSELVDWYLHIVEDEGGWHYAMYSFADPDCPGEGSVMEYELPISESRLTAARDYVIKAFGIGDFKESFTVEDADRAILSKLKTAEAGNHEVAKELIEISKQITKQKTAVMKERYGR